MRILILIISILFSSFCFGQISATGAQITQAQKDSLLRADSISLAKPIFSTKELVDFLIRIDKKANAIKELDLSKDEGYEQLVKELNKIVQEADKKRKSK